MQAFLPTSRDHLDYHHTMENYAQAKKRLFSELNCQHKILNVDDEIGATWLIELSKDDPDVVVVLSCGLSARYKKLAKSNRT